MSEFGRLNKSFTPVFFIFFVLFLSCPSFAFPQESFTISPEDTAFLEKIQKDSFAYFPKFSNRKTGLILDHSSSSSPSSIAATGFGLASYAIAQKHGWIGYKEAYDSIIKILKTLHEKGAHKNGFYYHFLDPETGKRTWSSEASSIDTALLMAGALLAGQYFKGTEIEKLANHLYESVRWDWMLNSTKQMCHGWKPDRGFLPHYWDMYSEHLILIALAIGSSTYSISERTWQEWDRFEDEYNGRRIVYSFSGSLFTYQYPHAFIDFQNLDDQGINYFENSKQATLANREFCILNQDLYPSYSETIWGLSASLGPDGYKAYGAKPGIAEHDGTIAPYTLASSLVFTPQESLDALRFIYENYGNRIYGDYGFKDAFNLERNWFSGEYLGIDQGIIVIMLENFLNDGDVWKRFMSLPAIQEWIRKTGLQKD